MTIEIPDFSPWLLKSEDPAKMTYSIPDFVSRNRTKTQEFFQKKTRVVNGPLAYECSGGTTPDVAGVCRPRWESNPRARPDVGLRGQ